jgi:hypothetical protein
VDIHISETANPDSEDTIRFIQRRRLQQSKEESWYSRIELFSQKDCIEERMSNNREEKLPQERLLKRMLLELPKLNL